MEQRNFIAGRSHTHIYSYDFNLTSESILHGLLQTLFTHQRQHTYWISKYNLGNTFFFLVTFFTQLIKLFQQKSIRADGPLDHLLLFFIWCSFGDANQPVLVAVVFLPVPGVDTILQNHHVLLARLVGDEWFGIFFCLFDIRSRINPPAINSTWARLLKNK